MEGLNNYYSDLVYTRDSGRGHLKKPAKRVIWGQSLDKASVEFVIIF